jgi:crotonobetainyl-CoA:carnitine CoA-transferase CaiB-like acyl-CoA transferase
VCDISGYGAPARAVPRQEGLRPADPERVGLRVDHRHARRPSKAGLSIADIAAGMYAYSNILAALLQRGIDGRGRRIDISMLEAMAEWMGYPLYYAFDGAPPPPRAGASHATIYPYGPFPAGDGNTVMLGCRTSASGSSSATRCWAARSWPPTSASAGNPRRNRAPRTLRAIIVDDFAA